LKETAVLDTVSRSGGQLQTVLGGALAAGDLAGVAPEPPDSAQVAGAVARDRAMASSSASTWTVEWFGTTTFRVRQSGLDLFFDGYLDRLPGLDPVGLRAGEVERADFVFVSHAHFDHLYGVASIARSTGATVVASPESARVLRQDGVPEDQLLMVTGGETVRCGPAASVRVLPALHSCPFAASDYDSAVECLGDLGVSAQDRWLKVQGIFGGGSSGQGLPRPRP
jgi:hypothetical protein